MDVSKGYELLYVTMLILLTTVFMKSSIGARFENHILINVPNASSRNQNVRGVTHVDGPPKIKRTTFPQLGVNNT